MTRPEKSRRKPESNPGSSAVEVDALTTRPPRLSLGDGAAQTVVRAATLRRKLQIKPSSPSPQYTDPGVASPKR